MQYPIHICASLMTCVEYKIAYVVLIPWSQTLLACDLEENLLVSFDGHLHEFALC